MFNKMIQQAQLFVLCVICGIGTASANDESGVIGLWKTEPVTDIGYLHISIEPCDEKLCGTIVFAFDPEGNNNPTYEHIGKQMVWNMVPKSESSWGSGKIWDPRGDRVYNSKMIIKGDVLSVSGCFLLFCDGQDWERVK